jgi:hypothetical protein
MGIHPDGHSYKRICRERLRRTLFVTSDLLRDWLSVKEINTRKRFEAAIRGFYSFAPLLQKRKKVVESGAIG